MKLGTTGKTKFKRLVRKLGGRRNAVGVLELLWEATSADADDGGIGRSLSNEDIAEAVDWPIEDAEILISALVEEGWLDRHPAHRLVVHDWSEHAPDFIHQRLKRQVRTFADGHQPYDRLRRKQERESNQSEGRKSSVAKRRRPDAVVTQSNDVTTALTLPSLFRPSPIQPSQGRPASGAAPVERPSGSPPPGRSSSEQLAAVPEIIKMLTGTVGRATNRPVDAAAVWQLAHNLARRGIPPVWFARWTESFAERLRKRGEAFSIKLLTYAAAQEAWAWCQAQGEWSASPPGEFRELQCDKCGEVSIGFDDGTIVPCYCPLRSPNGMQRAPAVEA